MKNKMAILQCADSGPLESFVLMLRSVGYDCYIPDTRLKEYLRGLGCGMILNIKDLVDGMGYSYPMKLPEATIKDMDRCDLYGCLKAHQNYAKVITAWPRLHNKMIWLRINGAEPERVPNCGDEVTPPTPVLTPNLWYARPGPWKSISYAVWPPFYRFDEYFPVHGRVSNGSHELIVEEPYSNPICLIHGVNGWGYGALINNMRDMGVKIYGRGSPDGLINHREVPKLLSSALCMVHLKSSDAPGYALYESLAAACPVVCTRRLIWRNRMESLFLPGKTCLVFDRETHEGLSPLDVQSCSDEVALALSELKNPSYNRQIGMAGREKLKELMWKDNNPEDVESLRQFMERMFP